jgi:uncharacterized lipoprotein YajG
MSSMRILARTALISCVAALTGCVAGQSLPTTYEATPTAVPVAGATVAVQVHDERPYVKSGDKPAYYVGKYRAGFGNPWDVTTQDKAPLADNLQRDIGKDLQSLGYGVAPNGTRTLDIAIVEWNFDGYQNGKFWYELLARVLDADGKVLASSSVKDTQGITGTFWQGAKGGFEQDMPKLYASAIRKVVRENPTISAALAAK